MEGKYDEATATEYSALRVPYETLNKKFRNGQKEMERANLKWTREGAGAVERVMGDGSRGVEAHTVTEPLATGIERLDDARNAFTNAIDDEIAVIDAMQRRIDFMQKGLRAEDNERHLWELRRIDKLVAEQLLRFGFLDSAKAMIRESKTEGLLDVDVYEAAANVEAFLLRHDTAALKVWISEHRSKLRRIDSTLEMCMWMQEAVECVKRGDNAAALALMRKHVGDASRSVAAEMVMGLIACGRETQIPNYRALLEDSKWDELLQNFRDDFATVYQLPEHSAFSACLQAGLAAHKTPACKPKAHPKCPSCDPIAHALSIPLPYAHVSVSRLLCAHTGDPLNEDNVPIQLPSGYVYGENSIEQQLRDGNSVRCSKTDSIFPYNEAKKLFIL